VNARDRTLLNAAADQLRPFGQSLARAGWRPELIVYAPGEAAERIAGYSVALVIPLDQPPTPAVFACEYPEGQWIADTAADMEAAAAEKADRDRDYLNAEADRDLEDEAES
jgi:hypothetical protein